MFILLYNRDDEKAAEIIVFYIIKNYYFLKNIEMKVH